MKNTPEVIEDLTYELNEVSSRLISLENFLISKGYQEEAASQKLLIAQQHTAMAHYKEILLKRLVDLRNQEKEEEEMSCGVPAKESARPEAESGTPAD